MLHVQKQCIKHLRLQVIQEGKNCKELTQRVSHMLLHHLPPDAETNESNQAERLQADNSTCVHPAGKAKADRTFKDKYYIFSVFLKESIHLHIARLEVGGLIFTPYKA